MSSNKLVSVVTANYNMAKYLETSINSILDQTYPHFEAIIVDDGSTDNSKEVIKGLAQKDSRVRYVFQKNQGQAKAKNRGIKEAKGDFIAFLDADDKWTADKLEKQLPCFNESSKVGVVYSDVGYMDENGKPTDFKHNKQYYSGKITEYLFLDNFINFNSAMAKRECFEQLGGFDENLAMSIDWDLWLKFSTKFDFVYLNEKTFIYRHWPGQMSHNFQKRFNCIVQVMENFQEKHASHLSKATIKKAWAHTFTERAWKARELEKIKVKALKFYISALKVNFFYFPAWKGIMKTFLLPLK